MKTFNLPDLGEGLQEAEIVQWHIEEGQTVVRDQPLVSVETDKAVVEIPSPYSGRIVKRHGGAGDVVEIGDPLVEFEADSETGSETGRETDSGSVVGALPSDERVISEASPADARGGTQIKATPAVRALARKLGVALANLEPSGPDGVLTTKDVERAAHLLEDLGPPVPLRGVRRAMAQKMSLSRDEVARTTVCDEADLHAWPERSDIMVRLVQAIVAGAAAEPTLNAWYDSQAQTLRTLKKIDLGIAVHTEDGLFVPVLRDIANRDAADLRRGIDALQRDVVARNIPLEELRGATITLSNFGAFGVGRFAELMVVPPQVAIIGAGRIRPQVVAVDGDYQVHRTLPISVTFDHRVVSGGEVANFFVAFLKNLESVDASA